MIERKVARGLGWFSIGLGLAEVVAGKSLGRALGMEDKSGLLRAFGVREIAAGVAILAMKSPKAGLWARVAGDTLDLVALGSGLTEDNPERENLAAAIAVVAGITALDIWCAWKLSAGGDGPLGLLGDHQADPADRLAYGYKTGDRTVASR